MDVLCGVDFDLGAAEIEEDPIEGSNDGLVLPFNLAEIALTSIGDRSGISLVKEAQDKVKDNGLFVQEQQDTLSMLESFLEGNLTSVLNSSVARELLASASLEDLRSAILDVVQKAPCSNTTMALRGLQITLVGASAIQTFVQANWTGPPVSPESVSELVSIADKWFAEHPELLEKVSKSEKTPWNGFTRVSNEDLQLRIVKAVSDIGVVDGESLYFDAQFPQMLVLGRHIIRIMVHGTDEKNRRTDQGANPMENEKVKLFDVHHARFPPTVLKAVSMLRPVALWWGMRATSVHQQTLESVEVSGRLWKEFESCAENSPYLDDESVSEGAKARFWTEYGIGCHHFEKVEKAKECFEAARKCAGLSVKLSGAWGKRTKFQQTDKSQLVILAESASTTAPSTSETTKANAEEKLPQQNIDSEVQETVVTLDKIDPDTPLLERIQFSDTERDSLARAGKLSQIDECILLALCVDVRNSYAMEELTAEEMKAYVDRVTLHQQNWSVFSSALLVKSQLEFERFKTKERAVLQMQVLVDQQSDRLTPVQMRAKQIEESATSAERLEWVHALAILPLWRLKRELGVKYKTLGVAGSALEIFTQLHSWDEAVECLVMMDKRARAEKLIRERLAIEESPKLMCILGDLLQDPSWFTKAWEASGCRYARAMRMLGQHLFDKGALKEACDAYSKSLEINPQFVSAWFRLGVAAMRLADWPLAKRAFVQVVSLEPMDGDSWANLCGIHIRLEEPRKALAAASEAVKRTRHNWKIWENYTILAVDNCQWGMAIEGFNGLLDLSVGTGSRAKKDRPLDTRSLLFLIDAVVGSGDESRRRGEESPQVKNLKELLLKLIKRIKAECSSDVKTWKVLFVYFDLVGDHGSAVEALAKRCRAAQTANWERDLEKVKVLCGIAKEYAEYVTGLSNAEVRAECEYEANKLVEMILNRAKVEWKEEEAVKDLETALKLFG